MASKDMCSSEIYSGCLQGCEGPESPSLQYMHCLRLSLCLVFPVLLPTPPLLIRGRSEPTAL